jgi:hypothetical protein
MPVERDPLQAPPAAGEHGRADGRARDASNPDESKMDAPLTPMMPRPWYSKLLGVCFVIFCFEIGVFLVVFPWLQFWDTNGFATYAPWIGNLWGNPFFRGALSGLGLVNIYISFLEIARLVRGNT